MSNSKYWNLAIKEDNSDVADLYLYNIIDDYAYEGYTDSAESILKDINDLGAIKTLNVYINSPGGSVFEGISIKNMLERQKLKGCFINVVIDGLAASIASIIAMAGDKITMPENALLMIHRASCGCYGNADEMAKQIEVLNKIDTVLTNTYVTRSNGRLTAEDVTEMFNSGDTWLTAQEAMSYGLCDEITEKLEAVAKYEDCSKNQSIDINKWASKVDEWCKEIAITNSTENPEEGGNQVENQPVNVTVNLDAKAFIEALTPIKDEIANLKASLETPKVEDKVEFVDGGVIVNGVMYESPKNEGEDPVDGEDPEDGCKKKCEDDTEPTDGEEPDDGCKKKCEGEDDPEDGCKKKAEGEEPTDGLDINFFDKFLNDLI